ncbi:MAG TPA: alpha-N-arabinofuranosidase [Dehalococcoidia bacterium]|nr:alpha-N-arabinofuranosidase [Dehalococcoidia bacterium]
MRVKVTAHKDYQIARIDDRLYGAFLEHLGRAIYTGIYEPDHRTADSNGMRTDVAQLVRNLNVPLVRYPGGNFVSAYNWEDGVGPRDERPTRLDLAWHTSESNAIGVHEFVDWCKTVGTEPMLALNLGTRGLDEARNFVEYVNGPTGSYWGDLRKKNGQAEPFGVKYWCLGNEMDGPWQIGHKTPEEYGRLANETAKAIRAFDKSLELVVCGSSNSYMPSYPEWERVVLEHTYDAIDHISLHMYFNNRDQHTGNYLAMNSRLDEYIGVIASTIDYVRARKRSKKKVTISFDEWNVWYHSNQDDRAIRDGRSGWPHAPRLLEDIYNFEDALQVACILNTFIRRSDVVRIACIAQLVNVIAPIMTEPNGDAWRQTIYYPYYFASLYGRGTAIQLAVDSPGYDATVADNVPYVDISGVHNEEAGTLTFFAVNRSGTEAAEVQLRLEGFGTVQVLDHQMMVHANLQATNTMMNQEEVVPKRGSGTAVEDNRVAVSLPPYSYHMLRLEIGS